MDALIGTRVHVRGLFHLIAQLVDQVKVNFFLRFLNVNKLLRRDIVRHAFYVLVLDALRRLLRIRTIRLFHFGPHVNIVLLDFRGRRPPQRNAALHLEVLS
jgi:hypothetical protein